MGFCEVGGQERRHGVGGVAVEAVAGAVVPACGPGVGVAHGVLYVTQRHAGVERGGGEAMPQAVGADPGGRCDGGLVGQSPDDAVGRSAVEPSAAAGDELTTTEMQDNALSPTGAAGLYTTPQRRDEAAMCF